MKKGRTRKSKFCPCLLLTGGEEGGVVGILFF